MLQVFKIIHKYDIISKRDLLKFSSYTRTRGHNLKLQKQTTKTELRKNSFSNRVVDTWNSLHKDIVNSDSVNSSKLNETVTEKLTHKNLTHYATPPKQRTIQLKKSGGPEEVKGLPLVQST